MVRRYLVGPIRAKHRQPERGACHENQQYQSIVLISEELDRRARQSAHQRGTELDDKKNEQLSSSEKLCHVWMQSKHNPAVQHVDLFYSSSSDSATRGQIIHDGPFSLKGSNVDRKTAAAS